MLVATFGSTTAWVGRQITYENGQFALQDHGWIPVAGVLDYDRLGQLDWVSDEMRTWAFALSQWEAGGAWQGGASPSGAWQGGAPQGAWQPTGSYQHTAAYATGRPAAQPTTGGKFPTWAIVLIIAVIAIVVIGTFSAVMIPLQLFQTTANKTMNELAVSSGARSIQAGIETWATDHGGMYPEQSVLNSVGMSLYVNPWPTNPFTDLPMSQGVSPGAFTYQVGPDGRSYQLVAYGSDGQIVTTLSNASGTTI